MKIQVHVDPTVRLVRLMVAIAAASAFMSTGLFRLGGTLCLKSDLEIDNARLKAELAVCPAACSRLAL